MAHGIIVYDDRGNKILDSGKRLGRFVGWHDINPAPVGQFKYSWDHRNLLPMGEIFVWVNPSFWFNHNGWCDCRVENGVIIFEGNNMMFKETDESLKDIAKGFREVQDATPFD